MPAPAPRSRLALKVIIAAAVLAAAAAVGLRSLRPVAVIEPVVAGRAVQAEPGNVTVVAEYSQELRADVAGRLVRQDFNLDPGQAVKDGDVLAQIDPTDLKLAMQKDQIDFDAAKARFRTDRSGELLLESLQADIETTRRLNKLGTYPDAELAKRERELKIQQQRGELEKIEHAQTLATFENTLAGERHRLAQMTLRAPFDAVVSAVYKHPGDMVGTGESIATLITTKRVVEGKISEEDFAHVRVGQKATVTFLPYGPWDFDAVVSKILPTADPETQRHLVLLDVKTDAEHPLVPGINGEMSIVVGEREAKAIVPRRALFSLDGDNVYVVRDDRVEMRKVRTGYVWARGAEILEGLSAGEKVLVEELESFHSGDSVRVKEVPSDAFSPSH